LRGIIILTSLKQIPLFDLYIEFLMGVFLLQFNSRVIETLLQQPDNFGERFVEYIESYHRPSSPEMFGWSFRDILLGISAYRVLASIAAMASASSLPYKEFLETSSERGCIPYLIDRINLPLRKLFRFEFIKEVIARSGMNVSVEEIIIENAGHLHHDFWSGLYEKDMAIAQKHGQKGLFYALKRDGGTQKDQIKLFIVALALASVLFTVFSSIVVVAIPIPAGLSLQAYLNDYIIIDYMRCAIIGCVSSVISNYFTQWYEIQIEKEHFSFDTGRIIRAGILGMTFSAFWFGVCWYGILLPATTVQAAVVLGIPLSAFSQAVIKTLIDQGPGTWFGLGAGYFLGRFWVERQPLPQSLRDVFYDGTVTGWRRYMKYPRLIFLTNLPYWLPVVFFAFLAYPQYSYMITQCASVPWIVLLSYLYHKNHAGNVWGLYARAMSHAASWLKGLFSNCSGGMKKWTVVSCPLHYF